MVCSALADRVIGQMTTTCSCLLYVTQATHGLHIEEAAAEGEARLISPTGLQNIDTCTVYLTSAKLLMQVFQAFIEGFGEAYAPLLQQIKQSFDAAIEQGLADALQNSQLRLQLMEAHRQQAAAEAAVRADIIDGECNCLQKVWLLVHVRCSSHLEASSP